MKAWILSEEFGLDALELTEIETPTPAPSEVLVRVRAASLNYHDIMVIGGHYGGLPPKRLVPVADGAGEIVAVGEAVTRVKVGDRVAGNFAQRWIHGRADLATLLGSTLGSPRDGMLAEYVLLDAEGAVKIPDHLSFEEASTLPIAGVTAWHALFGAGPLAPGSTVLVQGTGGVALFALQFARLAGARVIVTSGSDEKGARAREYGADEVINYQKISAWDARALELTEGQGVDLVVELAGGDLRRSVNALRWGGRLSLIGLLAGTAAQFDIVPFMTKKLTLHGIAVGPRTLFEEMNVAVARHGLRPIIHRSYAFEDARAALADFGQAQHVGKLVIRGAD